MEVVLVEVEVFVKGFYLVCDVWSILFSYCHFGLKVCQSLAFHFSAPARPWEKWLSPLVPPWVPGVLWVTGRSGHVSEILTLNRCFEFACALGFDLWKTAKTLFGLVCLAP